MTDQTDVTAPLALVAPTLDELQHWTGVLGRAQQLILEYAPQPPFHAGSPDEISPERLAQAHSRRTWMDGRARDAAMAAGQRLGI